MASTTLLLTVTAVTSLLLTLGFVPVVGRLAARLGCVAQPKKDRWHTRPTPMLGGVAFFAGFMAPVLWLTPDMLSTLPLLIIVALMFAIGIYDDVRHINPATKLIGQIIVAATAIFFGYSLKFFTWAPLDALLTGIWIVGLTNALNLLDNMDGLAGGIALIAALYLAFLFYEQGDIQHELFAIALAGAVAGFLFYNFHPASVFMGDAGSLFLGACLSLLAVQAHGQASNILSLVAIPTCILLVPILDTTLVTITRLLRGQPVSTGGRDHTSHRLVVLGLSERDAVLLLYLAATIAGGTAVLIEWFSYTLSLAVLPPVLLSFTLFTAYLAQVEVISDAAWQSPQKKLTVLLSRLTYKRRLLEVSLDFFVIAFAYYLAFAIRYEADLSASLINLFLDSLPIVLTATYLSFYWFGIYRGIWRYTGMEDLLRIAKAVAWAALISTAGLLFAFRFSGHSRVVMILYALLLFVGVAGSRLSFRVFGILIRRRRGDKVPIVIYGAGDGGEAVVRECRKNSRLEYRPVAFVDDDPLKQGRTVAGLRIVGGADKLPEILKKEKVEGCIISSPAILANGHAEQVRRACEEQRVWIKRLRLEFVEDGTENL